MTKKEMTKAALLETMGRLAEMIHSERNASLRAIGPMAIALGRIVETDESTYLDALADYRAITHPHASAPAGCRLY